MSLREWDQEIEALCSNSAYDALAEAVRFWSPDRCSEYFHAQSRHRLVHFIRVDSITVMNDVSIGVISGKRLPELLEGPVCGGMGRNIAVHDPTRSDFHEDEYIENPERGRDHDKEVAGHDGLGVITDEGRPALLRIRCSIRTGCTSQILSDGTRRNPKAQFEQELVCDSFFTPDRVVRSHFANEFPKVARQRGSAPRLGLPPPEQAKSLPMPAGKRVGLDYAERVAPLKKAAQSAHDESDRISCQVRLHFALLVQRELFAQEQIFGSESGPRPDAQSQKASDISEHGQSRCRSM